MRPHPSRIALAILLLGGLLVVPPASAASAAGAARDSLPSLDDLAGPPSTRFT